VLQFLWRDLTSIFRHQLDIVGHILLAQVQLMGNLCWDWKLLSCSIAQLKDKHLTCDGGSSSVATVEATCGCHRAYSLKNCEDDKTDRFSVEPWMLNPFNSFHKIFWLIRLSHQVRSSGNPAALFLPPESCSITCSGYTWKSLKLLSTEFRLSIHRSEIPLSHDYTDSALLLE